MLKKMTLTAIFVLLVFSLAFTGTGEEKKTPAFDPAKTYTVKQLKEDFTILRDALEKGHGGMYRYTPKKEMDKMLDVIYKNLTKPKTELEFFMALKLLIAKVNDGHTSISLSSPYMAHMEKLPVVFPINLRFVDGKVYLFRNYSEKPDFEMGGELVSINGNPISEIVKALLPLIPSDAHVETSKFYMLQSTVYFGMYYVFLYGETSSYSIEYRPPGETGIKSIKVKGIKVGDITRIFNERYPNADKQRPPISLEYKDGIPVLTIRTFEEDAYPGANISYPEFLAKTFKEFDEKKVKHLVIDLRRNGGGSDEFGKILAAYLLDKPFMYYKALEIKNNTFDFLKYTDTPPAQRTLPEGRYKRNARGWCDVLGHPNLGEQKNLQPTFKGKVFILIDGRSFSATGETTSVIHFHKKAVFVGEECGSGYYGNTSGFKVRLTLPNTNLRVVVPLVRYTMAVSGYAADRGIIPEYPVSPTIQDLLDEKDVQLEYVLDLIKKMK